MRRRKRYTYGKTTKKNEMDNEHLIIELKAKLAEYFTLIATHLHERYKFKGIDYDDAIQIAVIACLTKLHKYKKNKSKSFFNYSTSIIMNCWNQAYRSNSAFMRLKSGYAAQLAIKHKQNLRR